METETKQAEATEVGSNLSGNTSKVPTPPNEAGGRSDSISRIDRKLYEAAVKGNFSDFSDDHYIENLLTPRKNTVLHIHLTSQEPKNVSEQFTRQVLGKCGGLILMANAKGETPLHIAARYGHYSIVKLLIEHAKAFHQDIENGIGAEKNVIRAKNHENDTALHEAVRYGHTEVVEILIEKDPDHSYSANNAEETPLYVATERQHKNIARVIVENLKSPAYDGPIGRTALHAAVINNDIEMTKFLLENKHLRASVNHADEQGWVPLHHAVKIGYSDMTELLLEQDENTAYMQDNEGRTALHIAAYCGHWVLMEMIIQCYPDCSEIVDNKGQNALHYAVNGDSYFAMKIILHNRMLSNLYNEKDVDGNTPLHHLATSMGNNPILVYHERVDKLAMNNKNQTALDVAFTNEDSTMIENLIWDMKHVGARRSRRRHLQPKDGNEKSQKFVFSKEAKESHLLVATLIATVSFTAGLTLPGGTIQDGENKGNPILGERAAFKAFILSNTIALFLSASAALIHLFSPLNKASLKNGFLSEIAFSFTLVAVAAMIVAFATGTYAVVGSSSLGVAILSTGLLFFLVFRQVLEMNFRDPFLFTFIRNVAEVILFSVNRLTAQTQRLVLRNSLDVAANFLCDEAIDFFYETVEKVRVRHQRWINTFTPKNLPFSLTNFLFFLCHNNGRVARSKASFS